jgi:uroporphyrinogen III methyltransferase/synthase
MTGIVYLVGAGPGDPGLLTLRGRECIESADLVVYDALVDKRLLEWMRPGATAVYAGKREGHHSRPQEEINAILVMHARAGRVVTRLKGGDPFIFGRGGEEAAALAAAGVPYQIVPGVCAGIAVPAYAGIPLTHRDVGPDVTFVTGHEGRDSARVRWDLLAGASTVVFFMGLTNLPRIAARLVGAGRDPATPVAVVSCGTTERQETVTGTLATIAAAVAARALAPPALVVVGEVVALRPALRWFPELGPVEADR